MKKSVVALCCLVFLAACGGGGGGGGDGGTVLTLDSDAYLQYRTVENSVGSPLGYFAAWIGIKENGQLVQQDDITSVKLYNPSGVEMTPSSSPAFLTSSITRVEWNRTTSQFDTVAPYDYTGFFFNFSNLASLVPGTYTFTVQSANGEEQSIDVHFPGRDDLTPIASSSMNFQWETDGSLTLSWTEPVEQFDQTRIYFYDLSGRDFFLAKIAPGVSQVSLSAALVQQLTLAAQLSPPTTVRWRWKQ